MHSNSEMLQIEYEICRQLHIWRVSHGKSVVALEDCMDIYDQMKSRYKMESSVFLYRAIRRLIEAQFN